MSHDDVLGASTAYNECAACRGFGERLGVGEDKATCEECEGTGSVSPKARKTDSRGRDVEKLRAIRAKYREKKRAESKPGIAVKSRAKKVEAIAAAGAKRATKRASNGGGLLAAVALAANNMHAKAEAADKPKIRAKSEGPKQRSLFRKKVDQPTEKLKLIVLHNTPRHTVGTSESRCESIRLRLSKDDVAMIKSRARALNMSMSHYIRLCATGSEVSPLL